MTGQYLVFQSNGYNFALPASLVVTVQEYVQPGAVSFSEAILATAETEPWSLVLEGGRALSVARVCDIISIPRTLPLPGYIFDSSTPDWIRGAHWDEKAGQIVLVLNHERLYDLLNKCT